MRRFLLFALQPALAALPWAAGAQPAGRRTPELGARRTATELSLKVHESQTLQIFGATAAWPVDASIVDVSAQNGTVRIFARAAGHTKVIVVSLAGQTTYDVVVEPRPGLGAIQQRKARADYGTAEVRYSSAARELQNSVSVTREEKDKRTEVHLRTVHYGGTPAGDRARTSVPSASIRLFRRNRELTLLDRDVDHSPLTLSNTPVRGMHYLDEHWRLHAGYTAYAAYGAFLIPVDREVVAGAGYAFRTGAHSTLTPALFTYRGEGSVASLLYEYLDPERLELRTEVGYSHGFGGAMQLWYDGDRDRARADIRYRPDDFAVAGVGNPRGLLADATWTHEYGRRSYASLVLAASDVANTRVRAATADLEHRVSEHVALTGGASWGRFGNNETLTIPVGARYDFTHGSLGALYRYSESATNRGGNGFRVTGRTSYGRFHASAYVDRQENAPTLDLIFSELPELAVALEQLGITATTPADIARALRDNAALIELGYVEGVTVDLAPLRTQLGFELAFLGDPVTRQQFRARLVRSVIESVAHRTATTIATLTYSRALARSTDIFASYNYYRTERRGSETITDPFVEVGVRHQFDSLPSFGMTGRITGVVFADEDLDGRSDGQPVVAEVEVDGVARKRTNPDGTFTFAKLERGSHRVSVRIPERPDAYFTTPSRVEAETGDHVSFGVAFTPARVVGQVTNDAGAGIGGVRVLLARGASQVVTETRTDGTFQLTAGPGEWQLSILTDSVPAGHSLAGTEPRTVVLDRAHPLQAKFELRAHRSISGTGAGAHAELLVEPAGRRVHADAEGRFSIRSLPPGEVTVIAGGVPHRVVVPTGPATLTLDLTPQVAAAAPAPPPVRTRVSGERRDTMRYIVAIGAFRVHANAVATAEKARRTGVPARLDPSGKLTLVKAGPYTSRDEADAAAERLEQAGLEAVVMSSK